MLHTRAKYPQTPAARVTPYPAGVTLRLSARNLLESALTAARFRDQVGDVLAARLPLTVGISDFGEGPEGLSLLATACNALGAVVSRAHAGAREIAIAVPARAAAPEVTWQIRRNALGTGPLFLLAGPRELQPRSRDDRCDRYDRFWSGLWGLRQNCMVRVAFARYTFSGCPLLSPEVADSVLPVTSTQVPAGSAWIAARIDLCEFANASGLLDEVRLRTAVRDCVDQGDALHEQTRWPTASMRHDSWLNRRLALELVGVGELVARRRANPRHIDCLREIGELLHRVRTIMRRRSESLAVRQGSLPALDHANPLHTLNGGHDDWHRRWSDACAQHAIRNRNLLVLSPWSVFPAKDECSVAHLDLMPVLEVADAFSFPHLSELSRWNLNSFIGLHQRAWAALEQKCARQLFAEQV